MKAIHVFNDIGGEISASKKKLSLFPASVTPKTNLRHTLKYGIPMIYWYTFETTNYWFDVDLRAFIGLPGLEEMMLHSLYTVKGLIRDFLIRKNQSALEVETFLLRKMSEDEDHFFADRKPA